MILLCTFFVQLISIFRITNGLLVSRETVVFMSWNIMIFIKKIVHLNVNRGNRSYLNLNDNSVRINVSFANNVEMCWHDVGNSENGSTTRIRITAVAVCLILLPRKCSVIKFCLLELSHQQATCCREFFSQQVACCRGSSSHQNCVVKNFPSNRIFWPATRQSNMVASLFLEILPGYWPKHLLPRKSSVIKFCWLELFSAISKLLMRTF